jgi:hypothetical protein
MPHIGKPAPAVRSLQWPESSRNAQKARNLTPGLRQGPNHQSVRNVKSSQDSGDVGASGVSSYEAGLPQLLHFSGLSPLSPSLINSQGGLELQHIVIHEVVRINTFFNHTHHRSAMPHHACWQLQHGPAHTLHWLNDISTW